MQGMGYGLWARLACRVATTLVFLTAGLCATARAQSTPAPAPLATAEASTTRQPLPGQLMNDAGVFLRGHYTNESAWNPSGGLRQNQDYADQIDLGVDLDMQKLAGVEGAAIHVTLSNRTGRDLSIDALGNNVLTQEIYGGGQTLKLSELTWDQALFHDKLEIYAGRESSGFYGFSPINCNFQTNAFCGHLDSFFRDVGLASFPVSTWGARLQIKPNKRFYISTGAFEVNPFVSRHVDNDFTWNAVGATGYVIPIEFGYGTAFANDAYPRHYKFGAYYDSSAVADPLFDKNGHFISVTGGTPAQHSGRTGIYSFLDQVVYRPDRKTNRNLALITGFTHSLDSPEPIAWGAMGGLLYTGPFRGRDLDTIGFITTVMTIGQRRLEYLTQERAKAGGHGSPASGEYVLELNYGVQLNSWLRVMPNFQYVMNPDNFAHPKQRFEAPDAFVVGLKVLVDFVRLAGLHPGVYSH